MRKVERFKNDIIIDDAIVYQEAMTYKDVEENNWVKIEPKYYIDKSDDMIFEIWYETTGIILDRGFNTHIKNDEISTGWNIKSLEEINKKLAINKYKERLLREQVLAELDAKDAGIGYYDKEMMKKELISYNNKNLIKRDKQNNGGSSDFTPDYYGARCNCGEKIDAYTICDKYAKPHKGSAWHHSLKKLIRAGDGHKTLEKDIKEVIDSLNRWLEQINSQAIKEYCTCEECNGKCNGDCMI